ncbi:hypothetical protein BLNAU_9927 [Blattamonas nauphoetae]|uniref:Uncharacterized protein n=1 Tax=Blattamonas nauphoetae TaxID=2049346 RepID=A0ABQ9XUN8_9EUKA|nr:hypothetical protein BLNAU_9927 [Blattamonas nauphoetae]
MNSDTSVINERIRNQLNAKNIQSPPISLISNITTPTPDMQTEAQNMPRKTKMRSANRQVKERERQRRRRKFRRMMKEKPVKKKDGSGSQGESDQSDGDDEEHASNCSAEQPQKSEISTPTRKVQARQKVKSDRKPEIDPEQRGNRDGLLPLPPNLPPSLLTSPSRLVVTPPSKPAPSLTQPSHSPPSISLGGSGLGTFPFKVTPPQHEQVPSQPRTKTGSGSSVCSDGNLSSQAHRSVLPSQSHNSGSALPSFQGSANHFSSSSTTTQPMPSLSGFSVSSKPFYPPTFHPGYALPEMSYSPSLPMFRPSAYISQPMTSYSLSSPSPPQFYQQFSHQQMSHQQTSSLPLSDGNFPFVY